MRRTLPALLLAAACAALAPLVWLAATQTGAGEWLDQRTLTGFAGLDRPVVVLTAERLVGLVDPAPFAVLALLVAGVAAARRRVVLACVVAAVLVAAGATTQALKHVLPDTTVGMGFGSSWPSGHATAVLSLALCAVLVAPPRLRPLVAALGGLLAIGVGYGLLVLEHHFASDVVGGYLVATAWTALGVAVMAALDGRGAPAPGAAALRATLAAGVLAGALAGVAVTPRWEAAVAYADRHTAFVAGALALGAAALAAAAATAAAVREE